MEGRLVVLSGPSGAGKDTVANEIRKTDLPLAVIVSYTTRQPRAGEREGHDYCFRTLEEFLTLAQDGTLLEYAEVHGQFYGTPAAAVEENLRAGKIVLLIIDVLGMLMVKAKRPDAKTIFIQAPSWEVLRDRLESRELASARKKKGDADLDELELAEAAQNVSRRMLRGVAEVALAHHYDHVVTNSELADAARDVEALLRA